MGIRFILMVNKQGQTRLAQYYEYLNLEERRALEGEIVRKCLARNEQQENGHMVAGQDLLSEVLRSSNQQDASGNKLLQDVGLWISQSIKDHFSRQKKMTINLKYIDPTYMIRAIPSNASDNVYCTILAQSTVHGAMAGYTGFTVGPVNGRHCYIPFYRIIERQNNVVITDRMWARLLSSTHQPSFIAAKDVIEDTKEEEEQPQTPRTQTSEDNSSDDKLSMNKEMNELPVIE